MREVIKMDKKYFIAITLSAMCCILFFVLHTYAETPTLKQNNIHLPLIRGVLAKVNTTILAPKAELSCFGAGCDARAGVLFNGTLRWGNTYVNSDGKLITDKAYLTEISSRFVRILKRTKVNQSDWSGWQEVSPNITGAPNTGTFSVKSIIEQRHQVYQFQVKPIVTHGVISVPATSGEVIFLPGG